MMPSAPVQCVPLSNQGQGVEPRADTSWRLRIEHDGNEPAEDQQALRTRMHAQQWVALSAAVSQGLSGLGVINGDCYLGSSRQRGRLCPQGYAHQHQWGDDPQSHGDLLETVRQRTKRIGNTNADDPTIRRAGGCPDRSVVFTRGQRTPEAQTADEKQSSQHTPSLDTVFRRQGPQMATVFAEARAHAISGSRCPCSTRVRPRGAGQPPCHRRGFVGTQRRTGGHGKQVALTSPGSPECSGKRSRDREGNVWATSAERFHRAAVAACQPRQGKHGVTVRVRARVLPNYVPFPMLGL